MNLKKIGKVVTSKFVGTGPSPCKKRIYWAAVSQRLRNTALHDTEELSGKDGGPRCQSKNWKSFIVRYCLPCVTESWMSRKMSL
jgi:hypothetical protein